MNGIIKKLVACMAAVTFIVCLGIMMKPANADAAYTYKIRINKQQNCVTIYKRNAEGDYKPYKAMVCSVGYDTPIGNFYIKDKIRWHELEGPVYGQYCSRITGHILFHSVWYYQMGKPNTLSNAQYNKLGTVASHGCVRINVRDAKWIYDNCPFGTPVEIYNSKNPGPLGKPAAIKLPGWTGWDPTDETNKDNPYNKKKPSIKLVKGAKDILFNSKFNLLKSVVAKNTTGFDASKRLKYTIEYKMAGLPYKKVKSIDTRKNGLYRVKFRLKDEIGRKASLTVKYKVHNKIMFQSFTLNKTSKTLMLGGTSDERKVRLKIKNPVPKDASIKTLVYSSSDTSVATVGKKGVVKAVGPGTAVITASSTDGSGVAEKCTIRVKKYATGIVSAAANPILNAGENTTVNSTFIPADATGVSDNMIYTYTSSNPAVASVDANGNINAVSAGTAVITVTVQGAAYNNAVLTSQFNITVNEVQSDVSPSALKVQ